MPAKDEFARYLELPEPEQDRYRDTLFALVELERTLSHRQSAAARARHALIDGDYGPAERLLEKEQ